MLVVKWPGRRPWVEFHNMGATTQKALLLHVHPSNLSAEHKGDPLLTNALHAKDDAEGDTPSAILDPSCSGQNQHTELARKTIGSQCRCHGIGGPCFYSTLTSMHARCSICASWNFHTVRKAAPHRVQPWPRDPAVHQLKLVKCLPDPSCHLLVQKDSQAADLLLPGEYYPILACVTGHMFYLCPLFG